LVTYGMPTFMSMENRAPRLRRAGLSFEAVTDPDPSMTGCWEGSASTSKIFSAGAAIVRVAETMRWAMNRGYAVMSGGVRRTSLWAILDSWSVAAVFTQRTVTSEQAHWSPSR